MATISQNQWKQYIARLRKVNDTAADRFKKTIIDRGGYENIDRQKLIDYAYAVATKYGEASAALSAEMYDAIAELSGVVVPAALPAETASYSEVAKTVNGILKKSASEKTLAQGVGRLVKMAGTDTILSNAYRDRPRNKGSKKRHSGAQVAWIPVGDTCPFCLMLASKGWQNQTQWAANSHSEHIHANCDCTYAVRFNDNLQVEGYDPEEYREVYENAEGSTRKEKLNSIRRMQYKDSAVRDKINAQKRAAYALNKEKNNAILKGAADLGSGKPVKFDENAVFKVNIPSFSTSVNKQLSASARRVAEVGSESGYEYAAIIDLNLGTEVQFGTDKEVGSVSYYHDFLRKNPDGKYGMVHNHNTESGLSLPDIQEMTMFGNVYSVTAVTANGITATVVSNGKRSSDYLFSEFSDVGKDATSRYKKEESQVIAAVKKYSKGGIIVHDGRPK